MRAAGRTVARWRSQKAMITDRHRPLGNPPIEWYSSLSPGGLSNYWTAAVPRFAPEDFTDGGRLDERFVWPVTYDELVPFYEAAEDLLCITGPTESLPVLPAGHVRYRRTVPPDWAALATGEWANSVTMLPQAIGRRWMIARRGSEFNSYHVLVRPLEQRTTFRLLVGATATRLVLSSDGARVDAVEYVDAAGRRTTIRTAGVVLAAGTVDTTQLLLSSLPGANSESSLVGRYLHDHPRIWWPATLTQPVTMPEHPVYLARQPYVGSKPLSGSSATIGLASSRDRLRSVARRKGLRVGVQVFGTMVPTDRRAVRLTGTDTDRFGLPRVELDVAYDDRALGTLRLAAERFTALCADGGNPATVQFEDWVPRPGNSVHYAGSARMHANPSLGVVDAWNRVHSVPNLLVADMACFTTNPEKNPTLTAMALAARACRRLATQL
jgi:choline dehydrogenase-like flavoprotein